MRKIFASALFAALAMPAFADGDYIRPVQHPLTQEECSACHMAFPPSLLPARSWSAIMNSLDDHFGEDASLSEGPRAEIEAYLTGAASRRGSSDGEPPLRITELSWFVREHNHEVSTSMRNRAGTMSNCTACHRGAERGYFEDD